MPALLIRISIAPEFFSKAGHRYLVSGGGQSRSCRLELACVTAVQDNFGTVFGKALRECEPDALRRAGDERPLARKFEQFKNHVKIPCCLKPPGLIAQATS
jgi:hypothetical protein